MTDKGLDRNKEFQHLLGELWDCLAKSPLPEADITKALETNFKMWKYRLTAIEYVVEAEDTGAVAIQDEGERA